MVGAAPDEPELAVAQPIQRKWHPVHPRQIGYIQAIRTEAVLDWACERDAVVRMEHGIGQFVVADLPVASVAMHDHQDEHASRTLSSFFIVGEHRTVEQDAAFGLRQIVDMAVRALSSGINDPTTACSCLNYLGAILVRLSSRRFPSRRRFVDGKLRMIAVGPSFQELVDLAFAQIRQNATDVIVLTCLIDTIKLVLSHACHQGRRQALLDQLVLLANHAARVLPEEDDRQRVAEAVRAVERWAAGDTPGV